MDNVDTPLIGVQWQHGVLINTELPTDNSDGDSLFVEFKDGIHNEVCITYTNKEWVVLTLTEENLIKIGCTPEGIKRIRNAESLVQEFIKREKKKMTETLEFWEAMKADSEGKDVQFLCIEVWTDFTGCDRVNNYKTYKWRIKPEPIKYSKDVWLEQKPRSGELTRTLHHYLFDTSGWSESKTNSFNKHYKVTVEEVHE